MYKHTAPLEHRQIILKNPPFSKKIKTNCPFIHLDEWGQAKAEHARGTHRSMVLPKGEDPAAYLWPVRGLGVIAVDHADGIDELKYKRLSLVLLRSGCTGVIIIHKNSNGAYRYREANNASK